MIGMISSKIMGHSMQYEVFTHIFYMTLVLAPLMCYM